MPANNKRLSDIVAGRTKVKLGNGYRSLVWNNQAIVYAEEFAEEIGSSASADELIKKAINGKIFAIMCLLYGALKADNPKLTVGQFKREFKLADVAIYLQAVAEGIERMFPKVDIDEMTEKKDVSDEENDEGVFLRYYFLSKKVFGMSDKEFFNTTVRAIAMRMDDMFEPSESVEERLRWAL